MKQHKKPKTLFLFFILTVAIFLPIITVANAQEDVELGLIRRKIRYGYWELAPTIDNIKTDWSVEWQGKVYKLGDVRSDEEIIRGLYTIDPDGDTYHWLKNKSASTTASAGYAVTPGSVKEKVTQIHSSAPEVAFSVGQVYLSDASGIPWYKLGYENFTQAAQYLSNTIAVTNYIQNKTYVYRQIPYSFRVCFWTLGTATVNEAIGTHKIYSYEMEKTGRVLWNFGTFPVGKQEYKEMDSYYVQYAWADKTYVDVDPIECNLQINIEAPLFTSFATQRIETPYGTTFLYNNSWIGIVDATVQNIQGGAIDPNFPTTETYAYTGPTGQSILVKTGEVKSNLGVASRTSPPDLEQYTVGTQKQTIQPSVVAEEPIALDNIVPSANYGGFSNIQSAYGDYSPNGVSASNAQTDYVARQTSSIGASATGGVVGRPKGWLGAYEYADPNYWDAYYVATSQATGASLGNPQDLYVVQWNASQEFDPETSKFYDFDYEGASANYVNRQIINEITSDQIDRQYSDVMALDVEIPNSLALTLGAKMQPALHTYTRTINVHEQVWRQEYKCFGGGWQTPGILKEADYTFEVIKGQEVVNVFCTYTITFTVVMIDKYGHDIPLTNIRAGDGLTPFLDTIIHNDTGTDQYDYSVKLTLWYENANTWTWVAWAIVGGLWAYWIYSAYRKSKTDKTKSFFGHLRQGIIWKIIITAVVIIVVPMVLSIFLGGGLFGFLF